MSTRTRTAASIAQHLDVPPKDSLTLLTGTLECSANWITARLALSALLADKSDRDHAVLLVSWCQEESYWQTQLKHAHGSDISRVISGTSLVIVNRLKEALQPARSADAELADLYASITKAADKCGEKEILLLLDQPDILLATYPQIDPFQLSDLILRLRTLPKIDAVCLSLTSDLPFLSCGDSPSTQLETSLAVFLAQQAHMASRILSCRPLKTGSARDVSGVLRITAGGSPLKVGPAANDLEQRYLLQKDGGVKVVD